MGNTNISSYREYVDKTTGETVKLPVDAPASEKQTGIFIKSL